VGVTIVVDLTPQAPSRPKAVGDTAISGAKTRAQSHAQQNSRAPGHVRVLNAEGQTWHAVSWRGKSGYPLGSLLSAAMPRRR
jgi:hypothetical protein